MLDVEILIFNRIFEHGKETKTTHSLFVGPKEWIVRLIHDFG